MVCLRSGDFRLSSLVSYLHPDVRGIIDVRVKSFDIDTRRGQQRKINYKKIKLYEETRIKYTKSGKGSNSGKTPMQV